MERREKFAVIGVIEIGRGKDWVAFRVAVRGGCATFSSIALAHREWCELGLANGFGCGFATIVPADREFDVVFRFGTEPYSMKSNDCYRYIDAFGRWYGSRANQRGPGVSDDGTTIRSDPAVDMTQLDGMFVRRDFPPAGRIEITRETRVKSLISRTRPNRRAV